MAEVGFYHLQRQGLDEALPRLLERIVERGQRAVVLASSKERVEALDRLLWTYGRDSFLPHGTREDGFAEEQPIYLTASLERPNGAAILVLVDGADVDDVAPFERCLDLFDGNDQGAVTAARARWRRRRAEGHHLVYWQQRERGGWTKAQEVAPG
jgi:DNA polymerase III subunit chi